MSIGHARSLQRRTYVHCRMGATWNRRSERYQRDSTVEQNTEADTNTEAALAPGIDATNISISTSIDASHKNDAYLPTSRTFKLI